MEAKFKVGRCHHQKSGPAFGDLGIQVDYKLRVTQGIPDTINEWWLAGT